jgi:adenylylsulfate kinase-like enzyme
MPRSVAKAVLLTGVYGSGKSTVTEEIASVLEERHAPYAALDLDWLEWFDAGWDDDEAEREVMLRNLKSVVGNYVSIGITCFVMALSIESRLELDRLKAVLPMPVKVVRLSAPFELIEERLRRDTTSGRTVDLRWTRIWLCEGRGVGLEDFEIANDRPIREVALDVLDRLEWI